MNGIMKKLALGGVLAFAMSTSFANMMGNDNTNNNNTKMTNMKAHWYCTTNASSASTDADKAADKKMSDMRASASAAFAFAQKHCRDCTKITCEMDTSNDNNH